MTIEVLFLTGFLLFEQRLFRPARSRALCNDRKGEEKFRYILTDIDFKIQRYIGVEDAGQHAGGDCDLRDPARSRGSISRPSGR